MVRMYEFCRLERDGRILTVTLDRPKVLNSLHAPACFELDRIFTEFEADPELWVAIVTGAGERAFCAGHDLADAPDAPMPQSGWAGLAERQRRVKLEDRWGRFDMARCWAAVISFAFLVAAVGLE